MLKHGEVNQLAVFGLRRLEHCPPHFTTVSFDLATEEKRISDWIWENLEGRFFFGDIYYDNNSRHAGLQKMAAFELPAEASYFALVLNTVNIYGQ